MSETITVNSVDRSGVIQRKNVEWAESAYLGEVGMGHFVIDDQAGSIAMPGYKSVTVEQSSSTPSRIFTGFVGRKDIGRGETYSSGASREISVTTLDLNDLLRRKLTRRLSEGSLRPPESVTVRITWLLALPVVSALFADFGAVDTSTQGMDETDYRGRYPADVLDDCAKAAKFNYYLRYKSGETLAELVFRDDNTSTADTCTLSITNVMADINSTTVFATQPAETRLTVDPEHVYSGAYASFDGSAAWAERASTATAFADRDGLTEESGTKTYATALRDAEAFLDQSATEEQMLPVQLRLRKDKVGLIQAGQRISVRQTHMAPEGWDPAIYARILRKRVTQPLNTDEDYDVALDLSPQEAAPAAGSIIQQVSGFWGTGGSGFAPYTHFPNAPTVGNKLLVAISVRRGGRGTAAVAAPNIDADLPRWGAGAWTELPLSSGGFATTYAETVAGDGNGQTMSLFYKTVDSTEQDCVIGNDYEVLVAYELSSTFNLGSATLVRANNQTAATTYTVGSLGTVASGELGFMIVHSLPDETVLPVVTPASGWTEDIYRGNYPIWYAQATFPVVWIGHAIGAGATVSASIVHGGAARRWCGLAIKVGP